MSKTERSTSILNQISKRETWPSFTKIPSTTPDRTRRGATLSDVMVPMRDGIRLATDVYLPEGEGPFPTVLTRLPYGKTEAYCYMPLVGDHYARKGYAFVAQDVRGKWGSEGVFEPNLSSNEIPDGYDTTEWITQQPWSNGRVGMWGESYFGFTTFAGGVGGHPGLVCIAPGDITVDRYSGTFRYGALQLNTVGRWAIRMVAQQYQDLSDIDPWHLPLAEMANAASVPSRYFDQLINNPSRTPFWNERCLLQAYDRIRIPVLHWSGWYDNYLGPLIADWRIMRDRNGGAGHNHLFIGPWDHEGTADKVHRVGRLKVGDGTATHRWDTYQAFFDRYLMRSDDSFGRDGAVHYFVMGKNVWRNADDWPPPEARMTQYYLHSRGNAKTLHGDGYLDTNPPQDEPADTYVYDPLDPVADTVDVDCWSIAAQMKDRRKFEVRPDVLCYTSAPLAADLEITGPIMARLFAASSAVDTDFTVTLVDVFPDGYGNTIQDGILRTSYRNPDEAPSHLEPGRTYALDIDLWSTSYVVGRGHRLRVEISSSSFDRYDRNPNTGEPFGRAARPVSATQTIHHSAAWPSHIVLPVIG